MTRERLSSKVFQKNYALKGAMEEFSHNSEETQKKLKNSEETQKQLHSSMAREKAKMKHGVMCCVHRWRGRRRK